MEKLVYVIFKEPEEQAAAIRQALVGEVAQELIRSGTRGLSVQLADLADDPRIPPGNLYGDGPRIAASVSLWLDSLDTRNGIESTLAPLGKGLAGYLVTESLVQRQERDWADGEPSPGLTQLVCFPQPARLRDEEFFHAWHDEFSPFSFEFHPLRTHYVRNVVARVLTPAAPPWRAIVEERWAEVEDWTDLTRRYASRELMDQVADVRERFLDPDGIALTVTTEWILQSHSA
jgi:hypothetical protein